MKIILMSLIMLMLTACTTSPTPKNSQLPLENKQWEPVNKNYIHKKDF